jgi:hypothetical protein
LPKSVQWENARQQECQIAYNRGQDYLYLEQPIGSGRIMTHDKFGSQLFRQAIATRIGLRDQYNWREHEQLSTVMATIQSLQAWATVGISDRQSEFVA